MKTRILFFCISCLLWASCENSRQNYVIEGTLPSVKYDGEWIYLVPMENAPGRVDSVKITNASFSFSGQGEEMRVLRLRHLLRIYIQELLVVTEPGTIHVKADSVGSVTGTPQNDALQKWKEGMHNGVKDENGAIVGKISDTTAGIYLRCCRAVWNRCIHEGFLKDIPYPFSNKKEKGLVSIPKSAKRKQSFLNVSQMTELYNLFVSKKYPEHWSEEYTKRAHYSLGLFLA